MIYVPYGMKRSIRHHLNTLTGGDMESIDVRDLPEEQAQLVAAFVEFLRRRLRQGQEAQEAEVQEQEWSAGAVTGFAEDWNNEDDAIYDHWRDHYHVPER
jgi:hypothetical protein